MPESVLITGGSGFLGHGLVNRLLSEGSSPHFPKWERICVYSRGEHRQAEMRAKFHDDPRLRWFIGDVRDVERLKRAMRGVQLVIHAAALKRIEVGAMNPDELVKTNVLGTMNVIDAAAYSKVKKALLISSDKAYQPVSAYGQTKALAESLFLTASNVHPDGPRYAVVRYGNVFNSTGSVVPTWREAIVNRKLLIVTDPDCTRFFMTLDQAVDLVLTTAENMQGGELAIPDLPAYQLKNLAWAMFVGHPKPEVTVTSLPAWEKLHESMSAERCSKDARRMTVDELREALNATS